MWRERSDYSGPLVLEVHYQPGDEDYTVQDVQPKCSGSDCSATDGRLCDTCWFEEFDWTCGFDDDLRAMEWKGKGEKEAWLRVTGHMQFESTNSIECGWEYDEEFEIEKVEVLPEPVCCCGIAAFGVGEPHVYGDEKTR